MNKYKVGDKVRLIRTSYPGICPEGSIQTILDIDNSKSQQILFLSGTKLTSWGSGWTFYLSEVEPYVEIIEVGDTVEYVEGTSLAGEQRVVKALGDTSGDRKDTHLLFTNGYANKASDLKLISKANKMKEVVGYKLKNKQYEKAAILLASNPDIWTDLSFTTFMLTAGDKGYAKILREAGVLDLWFEPVYKEEKIIVNISGNRQVIVNKSTIEVMGYTITHEEANTAYQVVIVNKYLPINTIRPSDGGFGLLITEIKIGCQTFTREDIVDVNAAIQNNMGLIGKDLSNISKEIDKL